MDKSMLLACRILSSLYPDSKPSEVKKIIDDAMNKEASPEDTELWEMMITKRSAAEVKEEKVVEKVVEHHHHYDHWLGYPYATTYNITTLPEKSKKWYEITCTGNSITSGTSSADSLAIPSQDVYTSITM